MSDHVNYLVDTNILLRFLMNDEAKQGTASKSLFEKAKSGSITLHIPFIAITETVFTLQSHYGIDRADIGRELLKILNAPGVTLACPSWIVDALDEYRLRNVSFGDACLAAEARIDGLAIASFDKGLGKFTGVLRYDPLIRRTFPSS